MPHENPGDSMGRQPPDQPATMQFDAILRLPHVLALTGLGRSSIYRLVAQGDLAAPVRLSARAIGWHRSTICQWLGSRRSTANPE